MSSGDVAPDWSLGLACGTDELIGGYLGARLQPYLRDRVLHAARHIAIQYVNLDDPLNPKVNERQCPVPDPTEAPLQSHHPSDSFRPGLPDPVYWVTPRHRRGRSRSAT